ncbi:MAG: dual specificity protein phosphatase family protein [Anaerolineae bacterium]|nr:dual specificity protein phosphatase family protein [Anaerolineae bacterium]
MHKLIRGLQILWQRLRYQGVSTTLWWALDHAARILTGANIQRVSQITPHLYVGGQHRAHGMARMRRRGITAVVNMRAEFDDQPAGLSFPHYLYLPTADDQAPTLEHLQVGAEFIAAQIEGGGVVYVHCGSGIGRAATMAAAYFVHQGTSPGEAWDRIRQNRPFIRPTPPQVAQLQRFADRVASDSST